MQFYALCLIVWRFLGIVHIVCISDAETPDDKHFDYFPVSTTRNCKNSITLRNFARIYIHVSTEKLITDHYETESRIHYIMQGCHL